MLMNLMTEIPKHMHHALRLVLSMDPADFPRSSQCLEIMNLCLDVAILAELLLHVFSPTFC